MGGWTIPIPSQSESIWTQSPTYSAYRMIILVSLTRSVLSLKGLEAHAVQLMTFYGALLPMIVGESFEYPSFSVLARFWQDSIGIVELYSILFVVLFS